MAMALPEATEEPHFDLTSFRVRGKIFVTVPPDGTSARVFVDEDEARAAVAEQPEVVEELWWGKRLSGVRVDLARADAGRLAELVEEAWRRRAPKRVVAAYDATRPG